MLLAFRLGLGVAEAPCYPANSRILSTWFPQAERARATGVYSVGQYFGLAFLSVGTNPADALGHADGLVQTGPIGSLGHPGMPLDTALLSHQPWVSDIIYFPLETAPVLAARQRGCQATGGGGMAVCQTVRAFEFFSGIPANANRMAAHFAELTPL